MRALITGGAGFIGSHLAEALLARGDDDLRDTQADVRRARAALDLAPSVSFRDGLRLTLAAFRAS